MSVTQTKKISLLKLFWIFFKIGLVLFGGGYAILPFLRKEIVEKENICTMEELADYYALSQCFPGLVAGNVSMFSGYKARGVFGAFVAVFGVCLPAYLSIIIIFSFLNQIVGYTLIQNIFEILDIAVCVLILLTVIELWEFSIFDKFTAFIFVLALTSALCSVSPFVVIIFAGLLGLFRQLIFPKELTQCSADSCQESITAEKSIINEATENE